MKNKIMAKELLSKHGLNILVIMYLFRYSKENRVNVHDIIQIFKDNSIRLKKILSLSFSGYKNFERVISELIKEIHGRK